MRKAALRSGLLQSVTFDGGGTVSAAPAGGAGTLAVEFALSGGTQEAGRMTHARVTLGGAVHDTADSRLTLDAEVTAERGGATYFFLHDVSSASPNPMLPLDALIPFVGQWWRLPGQESASSIAVSPDPGLLTAQSRVMTVTADNGIHRIRGARAYTYDIAVDPERLLVYLKTMAKDRSQPFDEAAIKADLQSYSATGKLWIDAESFNMHRVEWDIRRVQDGKETLSAAVHIDFMQHDAAPAIAVPPSSRIFGAAGFAVPSGSAALLSAPMPFYDGDPTLLDVFRKTQKQVSSAHSS